MYLEVVAGQVDIDLAETYFFDGIGSTRHTFDRKTQLTWEGIAVLASIFPSKSQARKNGWAGPIPFDIHSKNTKSSLVEVWQGPI